MVQQKLLLKQLVVVVVVVLHIIQIIFGANCVLARAVAAAAAPMRA